MKIMRSPKLSAQVNKLLMLISCIVAFCSPPVFAVDDPIIEDKQSILWLSGDVNLAVFGNNEYDSFLGSSEVWIDKWGVSAQLMQNGSSDIFGLPENSEYFNLDLKRRFGSSDKSNIEFGLGWQELSIESQLDASGPRVSLAGRLQVLRSFQLYGSTSYFPELDDSLNDSTGTAYEFEAGLMYSPLPSLSFKVGYRMFNLEIDDPDIDSLGSSSGFLLGSDWSW